MNVKSYIHLIDYSDRIDGVDKDFNKGSGGDKNNRWQI